MRDASELAVHRLRQRRSQQRGRQQADGEGQALRNVVAENAAEAWYPPETAKDHNA